MRIFNSTGEKLYQEWVLRFCAKETKGQGAVPFNLLADPTTSVDLGIIHAGCFRNSGITLSKDKFLVLAIG